MDSTIFAYLTAPSTTGSVCHKYPPKTTRMEIYSLNIELEPLLL